MWQKGGVFAVFFLCLLCLPTVFAQVTNGSFVDPSTLGYQWLANTTFGRTSSLSFQDQSLAVLSLLNEGGRDVSPLLARITQTEDATQHCWPSGACTVQDTAFAYLVLTKTGKDVSGSKTWLQKALQPALKSGEWRLQLQALGNATGTCTASWATKTKDLSFKNGELSTGRKYYLNIASDLDSNLLQQPQPVVHLDCSKVLGGDVLLSLVYAKSTNELYIVGAPQTGSGDFTLPNGCFSIRATGNCDYKSTLFSTWALVESGEKLSAWNTHLYLQTGLSQDDLLKAVLARTLSLNAKQGEDTRSGSLLDSLSKSQRSDGSWKSGDISATSYAVLALSLSSGDFGDALSNGKAYLGRKQAKDGSWTDTVHDTSLALLALRGDLPFPATVSSQTSSTAIENCENGIDDDKNGLIDCNDSSCLTATACLCKNGKKDVGETDIDCGGSCPACTGATKPECVTSSDCSGDAVCQDGKCIVAQTTKTPDTTTPPQSSSLWFYIIIFIVLAAGIFAIYFFLIKTGKLNQLLGKKKKTPSFEDYRRTAEFKPVNPTAKPPARPISRPVVRQPVKPHEDEELDKSLKEAERLLKEK